MKESELSRMYFELARLGARCVGARTPWTHGKPGKAPLLVLAGEMSRYDPRLFGVLVEWINGHWQELNPLELRREILKSSAPQIWGVIGEFVTARRGDPEAAYFFDYLLRGIKPAAPQFFFVNLYPSAGYLAERTRRESLREFSKWGFFSRERPIVESASKEGIGSFGKEARLNILERLLGTRGKISISDYLKELGRSISRQQALKDLAGVGWLECRGRGRGAVWMKRAA